jgi:hypothetical protein
MDTDKAKEVASCELRVASKATPFTRNSQLATRYFFNSPVANKHFSASSATSSKAGGKSSKPVFCANLAGFWGR